MAESPLLDRVECEDERPTYLAGLGVVWVGLVAMGWVFVEWVLVGVCHAVILVVIMPNAYGSSWALLLLEWQL